MNRQQEYRYTLKYDKVVHNFHVCYGGLTLAIFKDIGDAIDYCNNEPPKRPRHLHDDIFNPRFSKN